MKLEVMTDGPTDRQTEQPTDEHMRGLKRSFTSQKL